MTGIMSSKTPLDSTRPKAPLRSQSTSAGRHRKKQSRRNKYLRVRSLNEESNSSFSDRERARRGCNAKDRKAVTMNEWRIWQVFSYLLSWLFRSKEDALKESELKVLQRFTSTSCWSQFIPISNRVEIRTLKFDLGFSRNCPAIVLIHGFASGLGVWSPCFDYLCQRCPVYALDLPGFGRSTRIPMPGSTSDIEYQYVSYIDEWRDAVGLENFILVGHGFGGYIATLYAMRYPERTKHLVLAEPWGFTELPFGVVRKRRGICFKDPDVPYQDQIPWFIKKVNYLLNFFHPLFLIGKVPSLFGKWIVRQCLCRGDHPPQRAESSSRDSKLGKELNFWNKCFLWGYDQSYSYMYHCNMLRASGVDAFRKLNMLYFWSVSPLIYRIQDLDPEVPISFVYGASSVVDHKTGYEVYHLLPESFVEVYMVQDAGHNIFIDNPKKFCDILLSIVEDDINRQRTLSVSSDGAGCDHDDLYWDCAWETLNLSQQNLYYPNEDGDIERDVLSEDWDYDSYEYQPEEAPDKIYFLAPQISTSDMPRSESMESPVQNVGAEGFYPYQSSGDVA